ncbi:MAG TPA: YXWGXW repeat-containing protein [Polyangiaceae bacterium]|nr:YXWGXW repeat-containing protein [Polyangiaceae bacterium]
MRHFVALLLLSACSASLPGPTVGAAPATSFVEVPFAPPPARVEIVPAQPSSDDIWIDGEWIWQNGRWAWRRGYWTIPPPLAVYSPSTLRRTKSGTLLVARGAWWNPSGQEVEAVGNESSQAREGPVVTPQGQLEEAAPNVEKTTH